MGEEEWIFVNDQRSGDQFYVRYDKVFFYVRYETPCGQNYQKKAGIDWLKDHFNEIDINNEFHRWSGGRNLIEDEEIPAEVYRPENSVVH